MKTVNWRGVFPALMTEMHPDGRVDHSATARHLVACVDAGCTGIIVLGTLGENSSLRPEEKEEVVRTAVRAAEGRVPVLAGIAEYTTEFAIEAVRRAARAGAAGVMVLPCMVYKQDAREAVAHYRAVAAATDLPLMVYNNPVGYGVDLSPADFVQLAEVENIVAVKDASHDSRRTTDMWNAVGDRFVMFAGVDDLALEAFLFGAVGWVSGMANCFPRESVALFDLAQAGRIEEARALYRWFMPVLHLDTQVKLVHYIKLANKLTGLGEEWVRSPRLPLEGAERSRVESIVRRAIEGRPTLEGRR